MKSSSRTIVLSLALLTLSAAPAFAQTATVLLRSGSPGIKKDLVIIGDGFQASEQTIFNDYVENTILNGTFQEGPLWESMSAFNITRINTISVDSGITQVDGNGNVIVAKNTALQWRESGPNGCGVGPNGNTSKNILKGILQNLVPERDYVFIVLNTPNRHGCRRGAELAVGITNLWTTGAHEMGHMIGDLADEYFQPTDPAYTATADPGRPNLTNVMSRSMLKWNQFVNPMTALPTMFNMMSMDTTETAGLFQGANKLSSGIFRPVNNGRMRSSGNKFGPVGYHTMKNAMRLPRLHDFSKSYVGDFDGDGLSDLVVHTGGSLELYISNGTHLVPRWIQTRPLPGWSTFKPGDRLFVGDFDGNGKDDLYIVNNTDYSKPFVAMLKSTGSFPNVSFTSIKLYGGDLPGWNMRGHDQFFVADFDIDGNDDLYVFNGEDWAVGYLGMLKSTGTELQMVKRYDDILPGWDKMTKNDQFFVADVDGIGGQDLYVFNFGDWQMGYFMSMRSTGTEMVHLERHDGELTGWDELRGHDQFFVADFDTDGDDDLYAFNPDDWGKPYLGMIRSTAGIMDTPFLFNGSVAGWGTLAKNDRFVVANVNGDTRKDLYVYNGKDWGQDHYLGVLTASSTGLDGFWTKGTIGGPAPQPSWIIGDDDKLLVGNFDITAPGEPPRDDLMISKVTTGGFSFHASWLGLVRGLGDNFAVSAVYRNWIHDHLFHNQGWW